MRAVQFDEYGDPEVLRIATVPRPVPGPGQALVRVLAASVNGHDLLTRSGAMRLATGRRFPQSSGLDFAGVVAAVGPGVHLMPGARAWGQIKALTRHEYGTHADYVVVDAERVGVPPVGLSPAEAVSLAVPGPTAVRALRRSARLRSGERVLVRGAAGGTGLAVVQLAAAMGAEVTTLSSGRDAALLRSFGARHVLDRAKHTSTTLGTFDVIVDTVGRDLLAYRRRLAPGGRMVAIAAASGRDFAAVGLSLVFGSRRLRAFSDNAGAADLDVVCDLVDAGTFEPVLGPSFDLPDIAAAHRSLEAGGTTGKRIVAVGASDW
jgi:NADPH:quinone reductase-like Zn-dependent oxidoreductase